MKRKVKAAGGLALAGVIAALAWGSRSMHKTNALIKERKALYSQVVPTNPSWLEISKKHGGRKVYLKLSPATMNKIAQVTREHISTNKNAIVTPHELHRTLYTLKSYVSSDTIIVKSELENAIASKEKEFSQLHFYTNFHKTNPKRLAQLRERARKIRVDVERLNGIILVVEDFHPYYMSLPKNEQQLLRDFLKDVRQP